MYFLDELSVYAESSKYLYNLDTEYSGCRTMLNDKGGFIGYGKCIFKSSDKLVVFDNFWIVARDKDTYPQKLVIKINNFSFNARIGWLI